MKINITPLLVLAGLALANAPIYAESLVTGSAEAGKARALTCGACHGSEGNSSSPMWPNLAGQNAPYIVAQLKAFKDGSRKDPLMSSQAMMLSDDDMANLAVYFESLPAAAQAVANEDLLDRGESLYRGGNLEDKTAACLACHGPTGRGNPAARYPALRGQHAAYTSKQLNDYANSDRTSDGKTRVMRDIATSLNKDDIAALSSYVQGLK
ncbi:MAG: cytochrome c4 [Woeseiaceae bacterium]|nr:cytochrome c4 [Woeseiaceae bacterium]